MITELTEEEMVYYGNYSLIDLCDCCSQYFPITNYHNGDEFLMFNGQFLCKKCRE